MASSIVFPCEATLFLIHLATNQSSSFCIAVVRLMLIQNPFRITRCCPVILPQRGKIIYQNRGTQTGRYRHVQTRTGERGAG